MSYVAQRGYPLYQLPYPIPVYNVDGTQNKIGELREFTELIMRIETHQEKLRFYVSEIGRAKAILGMKWLKKHDPEISWRQGKVSFTHCPPQCGMKKQLEAVEAIRSITDHIESTDYETIQHFYLGGEPQEWEEAWRFSPAQKMAASAKPKDENHRQILKHYLKWEKVFAEEEFNRLPPFRKWDHEIKLKEGAKPYSATKPYPISKIELNAQERFLDENLRTGRIRPSKLEWAAPLFFITKKNGKLRPVQDYRKLNDVTEKNQYPIPLISEILGGLEGSKIFTKLNIRWGYNNIRIRPEDCHKAAFRMSQGLFEPMVMFFGLTNSPPTFQTMMNELFHDLIIQGVVKVYMDDILIHTRTLEEHQKVVMEVLQILQDNNLYLNLEKCEFEQEVEYLGLIIRDGQAQMDPVKIQGVTDWPIPTKL
jgi:hypothetical protein